MDFAELLRRLQLDLSTFADRLRRVFSSPTYETMLVSVTLPAGATTVEAKHSLGRAHKGAAVVAASTTHPISVDPATVSGSLTVRTSAAPVAAVTLTLLVF